MIEEILVGLGTSLEDVQRKFSGVMVGRVANVSDPLMLGRVQVVLPAIDDQDFSPWARVAVPMAGSEHGFYFIPDVDAEVLVAFEHGDLNAPYVIGCLWNAKAVPPLSTPMAQQRMIRTRCGNTIQINELPPTIEIKTPTKQSICLSSDEVTITAFGSAIKLTAEGISIEGKPNLTLKAAGELKIEAATVKISGTATTSVESTGTCTVKGSLVQIN